VADQAGMLSRFDMIDIRTESMQCVRYQSIVKITTGGGELADGSLRDVFEGDTEHFVFT